MKSLASSAIVLSALIAGVTSKAMVGTSIGGWQVLEAWIVPSLFYRFLGKKKDDGVGMDCWSVCESLGPTEGNKLMRAHWDSWFNETHMKGLKDRGIEIIRVPVGDWSIKEDQYGPYVGCMDGSQEKIDWIFDMADKYEIKILLDVHALKGSQNPFDNSGRCMDLQWTD